VKVAFQVEGSTDLIVLPILVRRILNIDIVPVHRQRRPGGVNAVFSTLESVAWEYWKSDTRGLVIVIDNDNNIPLHDQSHLPNGVPGCNYCQLSQKLPNLPSRRDLPQFAFAIGVAVESLESWLLFGAQHSGKKREHQPEQIKNNLKQMLYGTCRPDARTCKEICTPIAENVDLLELSRAAPSFSFFRDSVLRLRI